MSITEMIRHLQSIKKVHGNINIYDDKLNGLKEIIVDNNTIKHIEILFYEFNK